MDGTLSEEKAASWRCPRQFVHDLEVCHLSSVERYLSIVMSCQTRMLMTACAQEKGKSSRTTSTEKIEEKGRDLIKGVEGIVKSKKSGTTGGTHDTASRSWATTKRPKGTKCEPCRIARRGDCKVTKKNCVLKTHAMEVQVLRDAFPDLTWEEGLSQFFTRWRDYQQTHGGGDLRHSTGGGPNLGTPQPRKRRGPKPGNTFGTQAEGSAEMLQGPQAGNTFGTQAEGNAEMVQVGPDNSLGPVGQGLKWGVQKKRKSVEPSVPVVPTQAVPPVSEQLAEPSVPVVPAVLPRQKRRKQIKPFKRVTTEATQG